MSAPEDGVENVHFLDPCQALVEFHVAADDSQGDESTLTGRTVLVDDGGSSRTTRSAATRSSPTSDSAERDARHNPARTAPGGQRLNRLLSGPATDRRPLSGNDRA